MKNKNLLYYLEKESISNGDIRYLSSDVRAEIILKTPNCDDTASIRERLFWLKNNLTSYPLCKQCQNTMSSKSFLFNIKGNGYKNYCSKKCAALSEQRNRKYKETSLKKYGSESPASHTNIQDKIKQTNLERYGSVWPNAWGTKKFQAAMLSKFGYKYPTQIPTSQSKIQKTKIENSQEEILNKISKLELKYKTKCQNIEKLLYERDLEKLCNIELEWKHNICDKIYKSPIRNGKILKCPVCSVSSSAPEHELLEFIKTLCAENNLPEPIHRSRLILPSKKELDIFIPELNIGFEFNGIFWHSLDTKDNLKHLKKTEECEKLQIKLIHIFENDWNHKKTIIESRIKNLLKINNRKIFARKCEIVQLSNSEKNAFLLENHFFGTDFSSVKLGLKFDNELVSVMTFGKSRFNKQFEWELIRFCSLLNTSVIGGGNKLFNYFKNTFNPQSVISYSDRCWGTGEIYNNLGFKFISNSKPSYKYVSLLSEQTFSRFQCQKHKLSKILNKFNSEISEKENMKKNGYLPIYDCGNKVFVWFSK